MLLYIKAGKLFALCLECSRAFGAKPLFETECFDGEIIIDGPYCRLIVTPPATLCNKNNGAHNEKRNRNLHISSSGIAGD